MTVMKVREYGINYIKMKIIYLDYLETRKSWEIVIPLKHMETLFKLVPFILVLPLLFCISKVAEFSCLLFVCLFVMLFLFGEMPNIFFCFVCVCVSVLCMCTCHSICVEVRGQPTSVDTLCCHVGPTDQTQAIRPSSKCLILWGSSLAPKYFYAK